MTVSSYRHSWCCLVGTPFSITDRGRGGRRVKRPDVVDNLASCGEAGTVPATHQCLIVLAVTIASGMWWLGHGMLIGGTLNGGREAATQGGDRTLLRILRCREH